MVIDPIDLHLYLKRREQFVKDFEINEFENIPTYELVNVQAVIAQRWLEDKPIFQDDVQQYSKTDFYNSASRFKGINENCIPCGPLEFMVLQLKFDTKSR